MSRTLLERGSAAPDRTSVDALVVQIGKLVRHRGFARGKIVSAMLLRHLPADAGYAWNGEAALHARLTRAALDATTINHLIASVRLEIEMIQDRGRF